MLDDVAAEAGLNLLTDEARAAYDERVARAAVGVDEWRTRRNPLVSQPMAFNVLGQFSKHLDLATGLLRAILGDDEVGEVTTRARWPGRRHYQRA